LLAARPSQVVCKPGTTNTHTQFEGEVYALTKEEGGRHTPFTTNYRPQFFFRTAGGPAAPSARSAHQARLLTSLLPKKGRAGQRWPGRACVA
jgi:hypothetical protein